MVHVVAYEVAPSGNLAQCHSLNALRGHHKPVLIPHLHTSAHLATGIKIVLDAVARLDICLAERLAGAITAAALDATFEASIAAIAAEVAVTVKTSLVSRPIAAGVAAVQVLEQVFRRRCVRWPALIDCPWAKGISTVKRQDLSLEHGRTPGSAGEKSRRQP